MNEKTKKLNCNVVLLEPEIPQNTGNIGRLCVGMGAKLHLIKPFGFVLDDKKLKRAGLDYWQYLDHQIYENWEEFCSFRSNSDNIYFLSKKQGSVFYKALLPPNSFFVFGKETKGLPEVLLEKYKDHVLTVPMFGAVRSYNLSNTVAMVLSEATRQTQFL